MTPSIAAEWQSDPVKRVASLRLAADGSISVIAFDYPFTTIPARASMTVPLYGFRHFVSQARAWSERLQTDFHVPPSDTKALVKRLALEYAVSGPTQSPKTTIQTATMKGDVFVAGRDSLLTFGLHYNRVDDSVTLDGRNEPWALPWSTWLTFVELHEEFIRFVETGSIA